MDLPDVELAVSVTWEQLNRAGQEPNHGWPGYDIMYPMGGPFHFVREPIFVSKNYRNLGAKHGWVTGVPLGPLATAPKFAGAKRVDAKEFRTLGVSFGADHPLVDRDLQVWELPDRKAHAGKVSREWRPGARLGALGGRRLLRGSEGQPVGRSGMSSVTRAKWALHPA